MSLHTATIEWKREGDFARKKYQREHVWKFDGGIEVRAAASPHVVPLPWTSENAVDPEEAFVASISSCHMLTFLWLASNEGWVVDSYVDVAEGLLEKGSDGVLMISRVVLRPKIVWVEKEPSAEHVAELHERSHHECFISRSVKCAIVVEPPSK